MILFQSKFAGFEDLCPYSSRIGISPSPYCEKHSCHDDRHLIEVGANVKNNPVFGKAKLLQQREEVGEGVRLVPHLGGHHHHSRRGGDGEQEDEDGDGDDNDSPERR